jgi:hypothetical protein
MNFYFFLHRISGLEVGLVWLLVVFMTDFWLVSCLVVVLRELQLVCACMHGNGLIYEGWTLCSEFLPTMTHQLLVTCYWHAKERWVIIKQWKDSQSPVLMHGQQL